MTRRNVCGWTGAGCLVLALSGCALPTATDFNAFAESTTASAAIAGSVVQLDADVESRTNVINAAVAYVRTGNAAPFPPPEGVFIDGRSDEDWALRTALLKSLVKYAGALAAAADPALADSVVEAASSLSLALTSFQTAQAARIRDDRKRTIALAEVQRSGALAAIVVGVGGYAVDLAIAASVRQSMVAMHPTVEAAARELKKDLTSVAFSIDRKRNDLRIALREKLRLHARDSRLSTADRYNLYIAALEELNTVDGRIAIAANFGTVLDNMVKAHAELRDGNRSGQAFEDFLTQVQVISAKIQAYQEIDRTLAQLRRA